MSKIKYLKRTGRKNLWFLAPVFLVLFLLGLFFLSRQYLAAQTPDYVEIPLDSYFYEPDANYADKFFYFYTDIPANYSGTKVEISAENRNLVSAEIDVCNWQDSCEVSVTPGTRLYFELRSHAIAAGNLKVEVKTPSGSPPGPVCGNGSCEIGEDAYSCAADCGPGYGTLPDGTACFSDSSCQSQHCNNGYCCGGNAICCRENSECPIDTYCRVSEFKCYYKGEIGQSCFADSECKSGYCINGVCRESRSYCGDWSCDTGETCQNCATDCGECKKANGEACDYDSECQSSYCVHSVCRPGATYCGDNVCDIGEDCASCSRDCGACPKPDGAGCNTASECAGGYCVHSKCRASSTYCGDDICDNGEDCAACSADCCSSNLKISFSNTKISLKPGDSYNLKVDLSNTGKGRAENVSWTILVDKEKVASVSSKNQTLGSIEGQRKTSGEVVISALSPGRAYLAFHFRGDNFGSIMKFVEVRVEEGLALDVPESIFLLPDETNAFGVFLVNQSNKIIQVKALTLESLNPAVVAIEEGIVLEVRGQGGGIKPDQLFSTESEDILKGISPRPKIQARSEGETELSFRLTYYYPQSGREETLERKTKVKVGRARGGQKSILDLRVIPAGIALERGETREVKIVLKNQGSEIIKQGKIVIRKESRISYFETAEEITFGFIEPGEEAKAQMEIIATDELPAELEQQAKLGELAIAENWTLDGQYQTVDGRELKFEKRLQVSLVKDRKKCNPTDAQCLQAVECLVELSNSLSCTLEFADIIPYLDKPVAVVLATADVCEIGTRTASGDTIGAAISSLLMVSDLADNAGEAVPGAGNLASGFADIMEGAADCAEGFVYDAMDQYCAAGQGKGYTGCAKKIFTLFAEASGKAKNPGAVRKSLVAVVGSPVAIKVVDNQGEELTPAEGVIVLQKEDLKLVFIKNPQNFSGSLNFEITGQADGKYNLYLGLIDAGKVISTRELKEQSISQDKTAKIPVLAMSSLRGDSLEGLLVGEKEVARSQRRELRDKLFQSLNLAKVLLVVFMLLFVALVVIMLWRQRQRITKNIGYTFWGKKKRKVLPK